MRGKRGILCLMLAAAVLLSGCSNLMLFEAQSVRNVELPDVSGEEYVAPWGDSQADYLERTGLYYVNEDAQQLTRSEISYLLTPAEDQAVTILNRLLDETPDDMTAVAPEGTRLLGVRAVIAESFERIHRSNLVNMGVLPLQLPAGVTRLTLGLDGSETFDLEIAAELAPQGSATCVIRGAGAPRTLALLCRLDNAHEMEIWRAGGILPAVLRQALEDSQHASQP